MSNVFQIEEVILWPKKRHEAPRRLRLKKGCVNVISVASKTGKSALIPIVDYCLGADSCGVPVGMIRQACEWFGIRIVTKEGEKLLARREPGGQRSTSDMFVLEGVKVEVPETVGMKNASVEGIKRKLDELAQLTNLRFDPGGASGFRERPSFRDMMAFCFQPQNVIANPDVLFFKADTYQHREKLRTIFPYVLGAVTPDLMAKQWELDAVSRDLRNAEREFAALKEASERWLSEVGTWVTRAKELGLMAPDVISDDEQSQALSELRRVAEERTSDDAAISEETITQALSEIVDLEREETTKADELSVFRRRLHEIKRLQEGIDAYADAMRTQTERLSLSTWLREIASTDEQCILCGGSFNESMLELDQLCSVLEEVEKSASRFEPVPAVFQRELLRVEREVRLLTDSLGHIRRRRQLLERSSDENRKAIYRRAEIDRFLGRLEQAVEQYDTVSTDSDLVSRLQALRSRSKELSDALSSAEIGRRLASARRRVEHEAARVLPSLDAEWPEAPIALLTEDLTVKVLRPERDDYLWEIGSGANWLAYHVAVTLALQKCFLEGAESPVPGLLIYDQPSQVYFPVQLAGRIRHEEDPTLRDEDAAAVRKVFEVLGNAVSNASGALQMLVLDHAGKNVWGSIDGVELVEEWRGPHKLVPDSWV